MQIKTPMRYHLIPVRMSIINKSTNNKCWQGCGERGTLVHYWSECRLAQPTWKAVWRYHKKLKIDLPFDPTSGNISKGTQNTNSKEHKHPVFFAVFFTVAKICKQLKCVSVNEWIQLLWDIYTMEYYLDVKKKKNFTLCDSVDGPGEHYVK